MAVYRGTDGNDVEALGVRDAVVGILLLKPIHFVPVQRCRPPRSQQALHELTGRLLGSDFEDRSGKHGEALDWIFPNDSSAKAIGGVVGGRPCSIPQSRRRPVVEPGLVRPNRRGIKRGANSGRMVPLVHPKV
jgi:hypothetical protein